jgi:hypothetical protein
MEVGYRVAGPVPGSERRLAPPRGDGERAEAVRAQQCHERLADGERVQELRVGGTPRVPVRHVEGRGVASGSVEEDVPVSADDLSSAQVPGGGESAEPLCNGLDERVRRHDRGEDV